jgi:hypothetical protein
MRIVEMLLVMAAALALAACKPTIGDAPGIGSGGPRADGGTDVELPDAAPRADAAPRPPPSDQPTDVTLRQTESDQIIDLNSIACVDRPDGVPVRNLENSYYRVFDLAAAGVDGELAVTSVQIGVESAVKADGGAQPATVRLHTLEGDLLIENLEELVAKPIDIEPQEQTSIDVAIAADVAAGSTLVVELFVPEAPDEGTLFFMGSNNLGESAPSYLRAPSTGCDFIEPTEFADVGEGFPDVHIVMSVSGTY